MLLHYNTIPEGIQKAIYKAVESDISKETSLIELSQMEKILEGTDWNSKRSIASGAPKGYDAFATLNLSELDKKPATKKLNTLF